MRGLKAAEISEFLKKCVTGATARFAREVVASAIYNIMLSRVDLTGPRAHCIAATNEVANEVTGLPKLLQQTLQI